MVKKYNIVPVSNFYVLLINSEENLMKEKKTKLASNKMKVLLQVSVFENLKYSLNAKRLLSKPMLIFSLY